MSLLEVFLLLVYIVGIVLGIYLIISLKKMNDALDFLQKDIKDLNAKLEPIFENIKIITDKVVHISDETEKRVLDLGNTIQNVRNTVSRFSISGRGSSQGRSPIQDLLSNLTAASKGVSAFWHKLNN
ncbi:MAG: hypothetical protein OQJ81_08755 [Melioribacteraceae bacterium]|nr:hypothetical protein [Melioribacteraceae bacterium]